MAEEIITILNLETGQAVKSVGELKDNIKLLKDELTKAEIGTEEYQTTLDQLKVNQNALKDAMYATSASMEDVAKAATGAGESYNALVHRMAALKEEFRATGDAARRMELGQQIKAVNDQLKEMDAMQGNFQRNVGNYTESIKGAFKGLGDQVDAFRKGLKITEGGLNGVKDGMEGIAKSPMIATISILVSLAIKLAGELKDNEQAMASIKKLMEALKPVTEFFAGIIDKLAELLGDVIAKVSEFLGSSGLLQKVIQGVMGVGNAILQFVVAPFKGVIAAIKVFKEEGVKGLGNAAKAFGQEMKSGVAFKQNFQAGQAVADTIIAGAKSKKKEVKEAAQDLSKSFQEGIDLKGIEQEIQRQLDADIDALLKAEQEANKLSKQIADDRIKAIDKAASHQLEVNDILVENDRERAWKEYEIQEQANQRKLSLLQQYSQEALERGDIDTYLDYWEQAADLEVEIETNAIREKMRLRALDLKDAEENVKQQKATLQGLANATSAILGSIADIYESDSQESERQANKIKALRIASATIDTISGAIGAYMQSVATIPPPAGQIVGAVQAAAVTAAGLAQIAQIRNTQVKASAGQAGTAVPAIQSAPSTSVEIPQVRSVTSASEEDRLNRMASDQRVYILSSDIEASQNQRRTQVAESSF
jgi:hypothetical protein